MSAADTMLERGETELADQHGKSFRVSGVLFTGLFSDPLIDQPMGDGVGLAFGDEHVIEISGDRSQFGARLPAAGTNIVHVKTGKSYQIIGVNHQPEGHLVFFLCKQPASP